MFFVAIWTDELYLCNLDKDYVILMITVNNDGYSSQSTDFTKARFIRS